MIRAIASSTQTIFGKSPVKEDNANMSVDDISLATFRDALSKYPSVIESFSKTRKFILSSRVLLEANWVNNVVAKPGSLTLEELDQYRYIDAPSQFSKKAGGKTMNLADVQKLVDWKL
jgi:hypothetical protein